MSITLGTATVASLDEVAEEVASWQQDGRPVQLHPGDLGWNWSFGAVHLAGSLRVWRDGRILAVGLVDDAGLIRMGVAPSVDRDAAFAARLLADLSDPARGVLPEGSACAEARSGTAFRELLSDSGWLADELWTPLRRDLTDSVDDCGIRVEVVDEHNVAERVAVQRAAFANSSSRSRAGTRCRLLRRTVEPGAWSATTLPSPWRRSGRLGRDDRACSSRWVSIGITAAMGTAPPSRWPRPLRCERWGPPARRCALRAATSAAWRRTLRPASRRSVTSLTSVGPVDAVRQHRPAGMRSSA